MRKYIVFSLRNRVTNATMVFQIKMGTRCKRAPEWVANTRNRIDESQRLYDVLIYYQVLEIAQSQRHLQHLRKIYFISGNAERGFLES